MGNPITSSSRPSAVRCILVKQCSGAVKCEEVERLQGRPVFASLTPSTDPPGKNQTSEGPAGKFVFKPAL